MTTLAEAGHDIEPIDETHGQAWVEWNESRPTIIWNEHLKFHHELAMKYGERRGADTISQWSHGALSRRLRRLLPDQFACWVSSSDWDDEDGYSFLTFSVWLSLDGGHIPEDTSLSDAYDKLWPAIATLFNVTDPGTFNSEYLFNYSRED